MTPISVTRWVDEPSSVVASLNSQAPIDPYWAWFEATRYAICGGTPRRVPVIFERSVSSPNLGNDELRTLIEALHGSNPLNGKSAFGTGEVPRAALQQLTKAVVSGLLRRFEVALPRIALEPEGSTSSWSAVGPDELSSAMPGLGANEPCTVLGVVDDGCCLAHEYFRPGNQTRFGYVWDQSHNGAAQPTWRASVGTPYGSEVSWREINALLPQYPTLGEIDERKLYAALGRPQWGSEGRRHGAGVLHVFAESRNQQPNPMRPIVFVQMPGSTVADTSGGSLGFHVVNGARYIVRRARDLAKAAGCPCWSATINLSLGSLSGPHDGSTIAEMALAEVARESGVRVVVAAGNGATWKTHAHKTISRERPARLSVLVPPGNPRETYVELWFPPFAADDAGLLDGVSVEVASPGGVRSGPISVGQARSLCDGDNLVASVIFARRVAQSARGTMALIALRATCESGADSGTATPPYGVWTIEVCTIAATTIEVHCWIQRNDVIVGPRLRQQASFVDDATGYVSTEMTLGSIANGQQTIVVGGYRIQDASIADYSGQGPTREARERKGPDYYAPSDESAFLPGMSVPGFYSGSRTRVSGTSVAAPRVARWLADGQPADELVSIVDLSSKPQRATIAPIVES